MLERQAAEWLVEMLMSHVSAGLYLSDITALIKSRDSENLRFR
jgi:hypothetical protein